MKISRVCNLFQTRLSRFLLVSWLAGLAAVNVCHALTVSEIKTEIRRAVSDNPSNSSFQRYSDAFLLSLINEAQREITILGDLADRTTAYVLTPRTTYYSLPADLISIKQVYFADKSNQLSELDELSQKSLYDKNPAWERNSGQPNSYWVSQATNPRSQNSAPLRISYIPIPTHLSTGTVTVWYSYIMPDLAADGDVPFDNRRNLYLYHYAFVYYAVMRIKIIENKPTEAAAYQQFYSASLTFMKGKIGERPNYSPSIAIPGVNR